MIYMIELITVSDKPYMPQQRYQSHSDGDGAILLPVIMYQIHACADNPIFRNTDLFFLLDYPQKPIV